MTRDIGNTQDVIDSRDIIERIEELTAELTDAWEGEGNSERITLADWLTAMAGNDTGTLQDAAQELIHLQSLQDEAEGYCPDWRHGATLIRDSYFQDYSRELAEDIGAIDRNAQWPLMHIDWDAASESLKQDYTAVDYDGVQYWVR